MLKGLHIPLTQWYQSTSLPDYMASHLNLKVAGRLQFKQCMTQRRQNHYFTQCTVVLLLLHGPEHMPQMHHSLLAYCVTLNPPPHCLEVPTSAARRLHIHVTQEILAAKGGTVGENVG
jgi:hypothetical protein